MANTLWQLFWPVLLYGLIIDTALAFCGGGMLMGTFAGALLAVPVFGRLYKGMPGKPFDTDFGPKGSVFRENTAGRQNRYGIRDGIFSAVFGIAVCVAVNTLIMVSPLPDYFTGFSSAAEELYEPPFLLQIGAAGLAIPLAEELVFRGIVFGGLRKNHSFARAACLSAAVFGIYHGNMLQGIYGFIMGWVLAYETERKKTIKGAVLLHAGANLTSIVLTAMWRRV